MNKLTSRITANITMNASILFATLGVAVAVVTEHVATEIKISQFVHLIFIGLILCTTVFALFQLIQQWLAARSEPTKAPGVYRSALIGSLFLCLVSLILTDNSISGLRLVMAGIALCVMAFLAFLVITWFSFDDAIVSGGTFDPKDVLPPIEPFYVDQNPPPRGRGSGRASQEQARSASLASVAVFLQQNPWYKMPQPHSARFFYLGKGDNPKTNNIACTISQDETTFVLCEGKGNDLPSCSWASLLSQIWPQYINFDFSMSVQQLRTMWQNWISGSSLLSHSDKNLLLRNGLSSTFLGFYLGKQQWSLMALGDTCLFNLHRKGKLRSKLEIVQTFPYIASSEFQSGRPIVSSVGNSTEPPFSAQGKPNKGDIFLMATRPLAEWLFTQKEQSREDWQFLNHIQDNKQFADFIRRQRYQTRTMIDDDTALLIIEYN